LKNRGAKGILISIVDGLAGFEEAIKAAYPKAEVQRCMVHQLRNTFKYVSYKDRKEMANDFKSVYKVPTKESVWNNLMVVKDKWSKKYPHIVNFTIYCLLILI
jgi:putative transposase